MKQMIKKIHYHYYQLDFLLDKTLQLWLEQGADNEQALITISHYFQERLAKGHAFYAGQMRQIRQRFSFSQLLPIALPARQERQIMLEAEKEFNQKFFEGHFYSRIKVEFDRIMQQLYYVYLPILYRLRIFLRLDPFLRAQIDLEQIILFDQMMQLIDQKIGQSIKKVLKIEQHPKIRQLREAARIKRKREEQERKKRKGKMLLLKSKLPAYFKLLQIPVYSELPVVKKSWLNLVKQHHPDFYTRNSEQQQRAKVVTQKLNKAYHEIIFYYKNLKCLS